MKFPGGGIANLPDVEVVVNAANAKLTTGGGVAGAIHDAAGSQLYEECESLTPIAQGEGVGSGDKPEDKLLEDSCKNALERAEEKKVKSVAFPAISTDAFGYPHKRRNKERF